MKVGFYLYFMSLRGTEVATYDFAHFNETLLGNESVIYYSNIGRGRFDEPAFKKFSERFDVQEFNADVFHDADKLDRILQEQSVEALYIHEVYQDAQWHCPSIRNLVHATFPWCQRRGDRFAYTSQYLARPHGEAWVPLMIHVDKACKDSMREELNIPQEAIVFGRYGGSGTYDIPLAHKAVERISKIRPDVYFIFMNTDAFMPEAPNVRFLEGTHDLNRKARFINTCDAMLHARKQGETFGLAVGEFSMLNKPVITYAHSPMRAHIEHLGNKGIYYSNEEDLLDILMHFIPQPERNWDAFSEKFAPEPVMQQFKTQFLNEGTL